MDKKKARALEKAKASKQRSIEKQMAKQASPEYREKQFKKQREQQEKQRIKQLEKLKEGPTAVQIAKRVASVKRSQVKAQSKPIARTPLKLTSVKGKTRNKQELAFHDEIAALGCICCNNLGLTLDQESVVSVQYVSVHHVYGRTGKYSHYYCLPLCQYHHDTPLEKGWQIKYPNIFPVHAKGSVGGKTAWEKINGTQDELIAQVWSLIGFELEHVA